MPEFDDDKFFDDILNNDDAIDKVDEKDADPDGKKAGDDDDDKDKNKNQDTDDKLTLEDRLAALEKENKGLKKAVVENRQGKSQFKTELDDLKGIIEEGLKDRGANTDDKKDGKNTDDKSDAKNIIDKLPLEFGEDGKGYVKIADLQESLKELIQQNDQKVDDIKATIKVKNDQDAVIVARDNHITELLDAKEGRDVAYKTLEKGWHVLDNKVRELIKERGIDAKKGLLPGAAMSLLSSEDGALDDFNKLNLGVNPEVVVRMLDTDWDFTKALDSYIELQTADDKKKSDVDDDKIIDALKKKPSGLGSAANQKDSGDSIIDKVVGHRTEDILDMDDASVSKLMKRMERESEE